ncbi:T9SS type A sorting domain-containing protein [candidate division KSB1 bacterium]|nr:T9SS type A sorting domain-containing protein [candidate division KSB1 bacterium]
MKYKTILSLLLLLMGIGGARSVREGAPLLLSGAELAPFLGDKPEALRVAVYDAARTTWQAIPFQVDERDESGRYFAADGKLDAQDELVMMLRDLGDRAAIGSWPANAAAKSRARVEIRAVDPLNGDMRYAYVFLSEDFVKSPDSYVRHEWQGSTDVIYGRSYVIGHDPNQASGLPTAILFPQSIGGDSLDFYQAQRFRLLLNLTAYDSKDQIPGVDKITLDLEVKERMVNHSISGLATVTVSQEKAPQVHAGAVRVVRQNSLQIKISPAGLASGAFSEVVQTLPWPAYFYYDDHYEIPLQFDFTDMLDQMTTPDLEVKIKRIELSQALDVRGKNMVYLSKGLLPGGVRLDDDTNRRDTYTGYNILSGDEWLDPHWYAYLADPLKSTIKLGAIFSLLELRDRAVGDGQAIFLRTFVDEDGRRMYGDSGLRIIGQEPNYISGYLNLDITFRNYMLADSYSKDRDHYGTFSALRDTLLTNLETLTREQDRTPPARIADLAVTALSDTTLTLQWSATGDDGWSGGPADTILVRYNTRPFFSDEEDIEFWWHQSTPVVDVPSPGLPGELQSIAVGGLDLNQTYYFAIRARDNGGNLSSTTIVSGRTTPVELAAFTATVRRDEVLLAWQTVSESNNFGFALDRRRNQDADWNEIGFVEGQGTTQRQSEYVFTDRPPAFGDWYYRLRQIDYDGRQTILNELQAQIAAPAVFELAQNYPNPFNPSTTFTWQLPADVDGRTLLVVYDLLGREIRTLIDEPAQPGYFLTQWDGRSNRGEAVGSGIYFTVLQAGTYRAVRKMIKVE